ncbi:YhfC family intramembrane metalloprotease [Paraburkholderia kururiensis]|uniref:YhfC family intramembrane metalloprotease n=1 Tax=Paraburkholderia kururiensis TaxID=984307 RepID=A0ABZ0WRZ4_9BURK|nr:YhfC family intramembrane metalloprotease [Paraburkholderia kururiensis]WQD80043.1 YhfC family intramembrane metalloprotease [Paraburkholderia kururiensis]
MTVSPFTLTCLSLATLAVAAVPILLYRRLREPLGFDRRPAIAGIAVFALFAMVIERALNDYLLRQNPVTSAWLMQPAVFVVYGSLAAGVCEEVGRFIAMRMLLKRFGRGRPAGESDGTGFAYGIGHGGAEAWMIGVLVQLQWIVFAVLENRGQLDGYLPNVPEPAMMRIHLILASLSPTTAGIFALERLAALAFQIGLSVLMWRGVRAGWRGILPLAVGLHALIDVPAALFQAHVLPLAVVDGGYALAGVAVAGVLAKRVSEARAARPERAA